MTTGWFEVVPAALNLRTTTEVTAGNRLAVLPQGARLRKLAEADDAAWWRVQARLTGQEVDGFVAHRFLRAIASPDPVPAPSSTLPPPVHLRENRPEIVRALHGGWAFPLGESSRPPAPSGSGQGRIQALADIIDWLAVDLIDRHRRWWKNGATTYCNVYASDFCYLTGRYLPRVWWTTTAIQTLARGDDVPVRYGDTVVEQQANGLFDWLNEYGAGFGWQRSFSLDEVQDAANRGHPGLIVAQRLEPNRPGHVSVVVPEHGDHAAARANDQVVRPLQSQAGTSNRRWFNGPTAWWRGAQFRDFGFWLSVD